MKKLTSNQFKSEVKTIKPLPIISREPTLIERVPFNQSGTLNSAPVPKTIDDMFNGTSTPATSTYKKVIQETYPTTPVKRTTFRDGEGNSVSAPANRVKLYAPTQKMEVLDKYGSPINTSMRSPSTYRTPLKVASDIGMAALSGTNSVIVSSANAAANLLIPQQALKAIGNPLQKANNYFTSEANKYATQSTLGIDSKIGKGAIEVATGVLSAIPQAAAAWATAGASELPTLASAGMSAVSKAPTIIKYATQAVKELSKNPLFWTSMASTYGNNYNNAISSGKNELQAQSSALLKSLFSSAIEVGGGLETIKSAKAIGWKGWIRSALEEGGENVGQYTTDNIVEKLINNPNLPTFSTKENAVINPVEQGKQFGMGTLVGGILGGGQRLMLPKIPKPQTNPQIQSQIEPVNAPTTQENIVNEVTPTTQAIEPVQANTKPIDAIVQDVMNVDKPIQPIDKASQVTPLPIIKPVAEPTQAVDNASQIVDKPVQGEFLPQGSEPRAREVQIPANNENGKVSLLNRTIAESGIVSSEIADLVKQSAETGKTFYSPITDKVANDKANKHIETKGYDDALNEFNVLFESGKRLDKNDLAVGQRLVQMAGLKGDTPTVMKLITDLAELSTEGAQNTQAWSMIKKLSPEGRLIGVQRTIKRMNAKNVNNKNWVDLEVPLSVAENILSQKGADNLDVAVHEAYSKIGEQIAPTFKDKERAWRYLMMLGNPTTHGANILGNSTFKPVIDAKNIAAAGAENIINRIRKARGLPLFERQHAILTPKDRYLLDFATENFNANKEHIMSGGKFDVNTSLSDNKRIFKDNALLKKVGVNFSFLEWASKKNMDFLDKQDIWFMRDRYTSAMAQYMKANKITPEMMGGKALKSNAIAAYDYEIKKGKYIKDQTDRFSVRTKETLTPEQIILLKKAMKKEGGNYNKKANAFVFKENPQNTFAKLKEVNPSQQAVTQSIQSEAYMQKAQSWAMEEGLKATFRDASAIASALQRFERSGKAQYIIAQATIPFKKTPINIAKRGFEYSPVGVIKGIKDLVTDINNHQDNPTQAMKSIDTFAQNLTGTGIYAMGIFLGSLGLITTKGDENRKVDAYNQMQGDQQYSFNLPNGNSVSLQWLGPAAFPLFAGVETYKVLHSNDYGSTNPISRVFSALTDIADPLVDNSFMQSLTRTISSYSSGAGSLGAMGSTMLSSLAGQYLPTLGGKVAKIIDPVRRSSTPAKDTFGGSFINQMKNKIPGLSQFNEPFINQRGEEERTDNVYQRITQQLINPARIKAGVQTETETEINRLYKSTGDADAIPKLPLKSIAYNSKTYNFSPMEMTNYAKSLGTKTYSVLDKLTSSSIYKALSDEDKVAAVKEVYDFASELSKKEMLKSKGVDYVPDGWIKTLEKIGADNVASYLSSRPLLAAAKGKKDADGKTIADSIRTEKLDIISNLKGNDTDKYNALYYGLLEDADKGKADKLLKTGLKTSDLLSLFTLQNDVKPTLDSYGNSVTGTYDKKLLDILAKNKYTGAQLAEINRSFVYNPTDLKYDKLLKSSKMSDDTMGKIYKTISEITGDKGKNGKTISGSQNLKVTRYIASIQNLTAKQQRILYIWHTTNTKVHKAQFDVMIASLVADKQSGQKLYDWMKGDTHVTDKEIDTILGVK